MISWKHCLRILRVPLQYMSNMRSDTLTNIEILMFIFWYIYSYRSTSAWISSDHSKAIWNLTDEDVQKMSMKERRNWLKWNPVTVARHMDHKYMVIFGRAVLMSGTHPIGQILKLNYDSKREFQPRGPEHPHCVFHIMGAPRIDENDDSEVTVFIDKYITCSILNKKKYSALNKLVNKV